jgi:hypothetical protein
MKTFLEQIKDYKNSAQSISKLSDLTNKYYEDRYGIKGSGGNEKFDGVFIPGKIYVGEYLTKSKISPLLRYINRYPTFLFIGYANVNNEKVLKSIDLNVIPPDKRGTILLRVFENFYNEIVRNNNNLGFTQIPLILHSNSLKDLLKNTGYSYSMTGFKRKYIKSIKIIDYMDWCKLPYLSNAIIQGLSINQIYNEYRSKLND